MKKGEPSWELDALEPQMLVSLITNEVTALRDDDLYHAIVRREEQEKDELQLICDNYDSVIEFLKGA